MITLDTTETFSALAACDAPAATRKRSREVVALVPAHNEEEAIASTLAGLMTQSRQPDRVIVVCDNCTDRTADLAALAGAEVFASVENSRKKAGALNQVLGGLLPRLGDTDVVLVVDADTTLSPGFIETALQEIEAGAGACGGVFYGEQGGGLMGIFQRAEYARYARQLRRNRGDARVLTGTASAFTVEALRALAAARAARRLPGAQRGRVAPVYTMASLTEDGEITLALKTLGYKCVSPGGCAVTTEIMGTLPSWWRQRTRWQRGALEDLRTYGTTRVTLPYMLRQAAMGLSVTVFALYVVYSLVTIGLYGYHTNALWLGISALFVAERVITVRRAGWREIVTAALIFPELAYDALQHLVWLWCVAGTLLRTRTSW
jgi:cellulose synthase/poly-beta-1,6-N-acetylglucosamine synthase-like glycosyltransferase